VNFLGLAGMFGARGKAQRCQRDQRANPGIGSIPRCGREWLLHVGMADGKAREFRASSDLAAIRGRTGREVDLEEVTFAVH
jgi:hypothetical protein